MSFADETRYEGNAIKKREIDRRTTRYIERYERVGANVFGWEGLPEGITSIDLEQKLINGNVVMFESEEMGVILARASITGWDIMDRPREIEPSFYNTNPPFSTFTRRKMKIGEECVLVQDLSNHKKKRMDYIIQGMIPSIMADIDVAIQQQIINQRAPLLFTAEGGVGGAKTGGKMFTHAVLDGAGVYFGDAGVGGSLHALDIGGEFNVQTLEIMRGEYWNGGLEMLGINNMPAMQKRERMNNVEVKSNEHLLNVYLDDALRAREKACEDMNELFGCNATVYVLSKDDVDDIDEDIYDESDDDENREIQKD